MKLSKLHITALGRSLTGVALMIGGMSVASAATTTASFQVTAAVSSSCASPATNAIDFSNYSPLDTTDRTATATLSVTCTNSTPFMVTFNAGTTSGATLAQRKLANGANTLNYNLYKDSAHALILNETNTLTGTGATTAAPSAVDFTVYASIPKNQNAVAGSYSDTITVTVTY
jgi:spore coat protein U-like protein